MIDKAGAKVIRDALIAIARVIEKSYGLGKVRPDCVCGLGVGYTESVRPDDARQVAVR